LPRGKYKRRSQKRQLRAATEQAQRLQQELSEERARREQEQKELDEIGVLVAEIAGLRVELERVTRKEREQLSVEIAEELALLGELTRQHEEALRRGSRQLGRIQTRSPKEGKAVLEQLMREHLGEDVTLTTGVHNPDRLGVEAVRAIQRARGLR